MSSLVDLSKSIVSSVLADAVAIVVARKVSTEEVILVSSTTQGDNRIIIVPTIIINDGEEEDSREILPSWHAEISENESLACLEKSIENADYSDDDSISGIISENYGKEDELEEIDLTKSYVQYERVDNFEACATKSIIVPRVERELEELSESCYIGDESDNGEPSDNFYESNATSQIDPVRNGIQEVIIQRGRVSSLVAQFENNFKKPVESERIVRRKKLRIKENGVGSWGKQSPELKDELTKKIAIMIRNQSPNDATGRSSYVTPRRHHSLTFYIGDDSDVEEEPRGVVNLGFRASNDGVVPLDLSSTADDSRCRENPGQVTNNGWNGSWSEHFSTALSIVSLAGTLGNVLRLPRMVYFHGGGVFLLVYILLTLVFGIPLTFLEIGLGQFCQHGIIKQWRAVNLFRGVGYAKVFLSFVAAIYYSVQVSTALGLLAWTAKGPLPFSECNFLNENGSRPMSTTGEQCLKATFLAPVSEDPLGFGMILVFLLIVWALVILCVMKRSITYKRAVYILFPVFIGLLVALIVEASSRTTDGFFELLNFEWSSLADVQVWYFATVQMFFSLHLGFGNINTCAGRLYPKSNAFLTAITLVICNLIVGVASVVLTYLWLGEIQMSNLRIPVSEVPELFVLTVVYNASSNSSSPWASLWACLAYLLVFVAGLSSLIVFIYTILVAVAVETKRKWHWWHINFAVSLFAGVLAILSLIPSYQAISHVLDHYVIGRGVIFLTILEVIGFAMIYGCSNLYNDLEFVIGRKLSSAWRSLWIVTPFVLFIVELCSANLLPLTGEAPVPDELWKYSMGWSLYFLCWLIVIVFAIYQVCVQVDYNLAQKFMSAVKPSRNWGPVDPIYRHCWVQWRNRYNLTGTRDFTLKRRGTKDYTHHARTAAADSVSHSFDLGGVNPSGDWGYKRASSTPIKMEYPNDHICWRKPDILTTRH